VLLHIGRRCGIRSGIRFDADAVADALRSMLWIPGRQEVAGLARFAVAPDKDKEALAGCNDVASLKAWVVHGPLVCSCGVFFIGRRWVCGLRAGIRHEFLRPALSVLHALSPLLGGKRCVRKVLRILREAGCR
jgi:hypothetical protein